MWRRNSRPRPLPVAAPGIRPGTSATVNDVLAGLHHAQVRHQGGERVVGDLRLGRRDDRDQRRLAGRREADQPDVGDALELEDDVELLAGLTELGEAGRLAAGVGQRRRCPARRARPGPPRAWCRRRPGRRGPRRPGSARRCRSGTFRIRSPPLAPSRLPPGAALAVLGLDVRPEVEVEQRVHVRVHHERDAAAVPAVAAVRPAERLELLAEDRRRSRARRRPPAGAGRLGRRNVATTATSSPLRVRRIRSQRPYRETATADPGSARGPPSDSR